MDILAKRTGFLISEVIYDSTGAQFLRSENYRNNVPLFARKKRFKRREVLSAEERASGLNSEGNGDQACFILRRL